MNDRVPDWVRMVIVALLGLPQVATGLWAVVGPRSWYDRFPGVDPRLVAAEPPFNHHLATDAGAGFLATGVALLVAATLGQRNGTFIALIAFLAFSVPHLVYHAANPAPGLTAPEDVTNVVVLGLGTAVGLVFAWTMRPLRLSRDGRQSLN